MTEATVDVAPPPRHVCDMRNAAESSGPSFFVKERTLFVALALVAVYFLVWPLYRAFYLVEIMPNEGWNAYFQDAAVHGGTLYPPAAALILNNDPPLSFYAVGWLGSLFGNSLFAGRALSIVALFGTAAAIGGIVRQLGGARSSAILGGLCFIAVMTAAFHRFIGTNEPQLVTAFLMASALAWFLSSVTHGRAPEPALLLMVLAGFFKYSAAAIPITAVAWMFLSGYAKAWRATAVAVAGAFAGLAVCYAAFGADVLTNLLWSRNYSFWKMLDGIHKLQWVAVPLVVWAIWAWQCRKTKAAKFTGLYVLVALVAYMAAFGGDGVIDTAQFDLIIASSVAFAIAYDRFGETAQARRTGVARCRAVIILALLLRLALNQRYESAAILTSADYRAQFPAAEGMFRSEAQKVAAMPGDVACRFKLVCWAAGKPFAADDYKIRQILDRPHLDEDELQGFLSRHGVAYARNSPGVSAEALRRDIFASMAR
ncbi:MAG: glycosyltransferase family 39 protein [Variibacter sp.]